MLLCLLEFLLALVLFVPLEVGLNVAEPVQQSVVLQNLEVLNVEVGLVSALILFIRLPGIHTLEYAEPSEISQGQLQASDGMAPRQVLSSRSLGSFLDFPAHFLECFF